MRIQRDAVTRSIHIYTSPIKLPTQTDPYSGWLELYLRDETDVWFDSYQYSWMLGDLDELTSQKTSEAFCSANEERLLKSFRTYAPITKPNFI